MCSQIASSAAGIFIFMCTNMILAAAQNHVLRNPALERWLELPPKVSKDADKAQLVGPSPWPPALVPLGLSLDRPRNALLGTPQIAKPVPKPTPLPQAQLKNIPPLVPAAAEQAHFENSIPKANSKFAVRRARSVESLPADA